MAAFGSFGDLIGQFNRRSGIAVDKDGDIYVTDRLNHRVQVFTPEFGFITAFKGEAEIGLGKAPDQLLAAFGQFLQDLGHAETPRRPSRRRRRNKQCPFPGLHPALPPGHGPDPARRPIPPCHLGRTTFSLSGIAPYQFRNTRVGWRAPPTMTVPVSMAAITASLNLGWEIHSWVTANRVPIWAPWAPKARAAT